MAVPESLQKLLEEGVIDEIQRRLMSGKEASVYVVTRRGEVVAAKVYKARDRRSFKATSSYTEGRNQTRNTRDKRAMDRRSSYGKELMEDSWRDMEYRALIDAHYAGVRVPKAIMIYEDVLLMELLLDAEGQPAPRLADFDLTADEANEMFREIYRQVRLLLGTGRIHGDLSAFNILIAAAGPTLIDLPQALDAPNNSQSRSILTRDLRNVVEHLARFDERLLRYLDCGDPLFHHYQRGTLDEATEPREVRRVHTGGRRVSGQERAEGQVGQPRRGGPQRGHPQGPQRGPQHGQQGSRRGPQPGPQRGAQGPQRGQPQGPQRGGPPGRAPQHGGQAPSAGPPRNDRTANDPHRQRPTSAPQQGRDARGRGGQGERSDARHARPDERSGAPRHGRPDERSGAPRHGRPDERSGAPRHGRPDERSGAPRHARPDERSGAPRHAPRPDGRSAASQRFADGDAPREVRAPEVTVRRRGPR